MNSKNNLSSLLSQLLLLSNNSIESFAKINEAVTSDAESVTVNVENPDGSVDTFTIPSFGWLKNSIERLNNNINAMSNITGAGSTVRLSDGTYRKIVTAKLPSEAATITKLGTVNNFKIKSNYFFENMMNPLLCVTIDLTGQVKPDTDKLVVKRFLLDTDTTAKAELFEREFNGNAKIDYNDFLHTLIDNKISYVLDEETVSVQPKMKKYSGNFSVIKITNDTVTELINGVSVSRTRKLVKLNTLNYTDNSAGYSNTMQLAVGDSIEVNSDPVDTRYVIKQIDTSTNTVVLELAEGYRAVKMGADYFRISASRDAAVTMDVTVGYNEHCVVFVKAADPDSNMLAANWSPGTGFFTNNLAFTDSNGVQMTLQQYYQRSVIDFGAFLLSYANDWYPTSSEGIKPNAPVLETKNFKVVQINKQVTESEEISRIKQLNAEKSNLSAQITAKSNAINDLKTKINTTNYASTALKNADVLDLQDKIREYESMTSTYASKVSAISSLANASSVAGVSPKFRIRGFWEMPVEQSSDATGAQAIIKFKIRYRYLSPDGSANNVEQIGDTVSGSFSNYAVVESVLRERVKDTNGVFYWKPIDLNDSDEININQLDIPITKGEQVEIQVKSISEAGFPSNPLESDWSDPIIIEFPEEYSTDSVVDSILQSNTADEAQMLINQTLQSRGVMSHLSDAFNTSDKSYMHSAQNIASGFVSEEQTPISLYQKLADMQTTINQLLDIIGDSTGTMVVTLSDENGNVYELKKDTVTRIFAGSYINEAKKLTVKKGAIISKNFNINIQNTAQTGLRLLAHIAGSRTGMVKQSNPYTDGANGTRNYYPNKDTYDVQDTMYNTHYRYDLVPINVYSEDPNIVDGVTSSPNLYQSAQCKNQFINVRFFDVSGDIKLYKHEDGDDNAAISDRFWDNESTIVLNPNGNPSTESFLWNPIVGFDATNGNPITLNESPSSVTDFMVHIEHPYVKKMAAWLTQINEILGTGANEPISTVTAFANTLNKYIFRLPKNEAYTISNNTVKSTVLSKSAKAALKTKIYKQIPYEFFNYNVADESALVQNNANEDTYLTLTHKIGYEPNDQYLVGKDTCTSFLFLNPANHTSIQVEGDSKMSSKVVTGGSVISIPLTFQYRMTDYWGEGNMGGGRILGDANISTVNKTSLSNIQMANRIGIDIWESKDTPVSFDIEIYATYGDSSSNINPDSLIQYNAATMTTAVNGSKATKNLVKGVSEISPVVPQTHK